MRARTRTQHRGTRTRTRSPPKRPIFMMNQNTPPPRTTSKSQFLLPNLCCHRLQRSRTQSIVVLPALCVFAPLRKILQSHKDARKTVLVDPRTNFARKIPVTPVQIFLPKKSFCQSMSSSPILPLYSYSAPRYSYSITTAKATSVHDRITANTLFPETRATPVRNNFWPTVLHAIVHSCR